MSDLGLHTKNGTGRALRGIRAAGDGTYWGTVWDVTGHCAIRPISRHRIRVIARRMSMQAIGTQLNISHEAQLEVIETTGVDRGEVRMTYLMSWFAAPLVLLAPAIVTGIVIWRVGLDAMSSLGRSVVIFGPLIWLSLGSQALCDWLNKRLHKLE